MNEQLPARRKAELNPLHFHGHDALNGHPAGGPGGR